MDGYCDGFYGDVFVTKLNNTLTTLLTSTFIGGSDDEGALALTPDSSGNVFIAGYTYSNDYPTTPDAYDITCGSGGNCDGFYVDAFVSKLPPIFYTLTVTKTGTGTGTVSSSPIGIDCGIDCKEKYAKGMVVTLTATADSNSIITGWTGCTTVSPDKTTCTVAMTAAKTVTVTFTAYQLTVTKPSGGTVTTDPAGGISCGTGGTDCTEKYIPGTPVTLKATPDAGYGIGTWTGCTTVSPDKTTCTITMNAAKTVKVTFTPE